jgi:single-strand DNA-binding protein
MIYTHTIGRIGKDCKTITGAHGTFIAVDMAVDDYSKGQNITTWVRVRSSRENHIRLAEYLTKGRLILVEGTISTSQWTDRQGESHTQISINADSIAFVNAGKKDEQDTDPKKAAKKGAKAKNTPQPPQDAPDLTRRERFALSGILIIASLNPAFSCYRDEFEFVD